MGIHNSDLGNMSPLILRLNLLQVGRQDARIEEFVNGSIGEPDGPTVMFAVGKPGITGREYQFGNYGCVVGRLR
jgi:hypothetical protein